jgi:hypothetical protein
MAAYSNPIVFRNGLVKFGSTDFTNQVTKARLIPDTPSQTLRTLVPDGTVTDVDSTSWTLELTFLQDWETGGLAAYLNTNNGSLITVTLAAVAGTGKKQATFSVRCVPVDFGGEQGNFLTSEVTLNIQGSPTFGTQA